MFGVGIETLMEQSHYEQWSPSAATGSLSQGLQQEDILTFRV
jgi:hypothetical protein